MTIKKINDFPSSPELIIGMLAGYAKTIKHIAAVVIWEDGTFQMVNDSMSLSDHAFAIAVLQRALLAEMDKVEEGQ